MPASSTLIDLLKAGAGNEAALAAPGRPALTYDGLRALAERTISRLNALGIGRNDRVAIVLPNGAEMAAAFVAIGAQLSSNAEDNFLNIIALFHIHGLIAAVLSSLAAGASITCTPGFNALKFFGWLDDHKPSLYTAVPTMHQAILARAGRNRDSIARANLRFVRSSSSSLPPQ